MAIVHKWQTAAMTDAELEATAAAHGERGEPLPRDIIVTLTAERVDIAADIYSNAGRRHHAEAAELDQFKSARKYPQ